jgi:hypothetical protein
MTHSACLHVTVAIFPASLMGPAFVRIASDALP